MLDVFIDSVPDNLGPFFTIFLLPFLILVPMTFDLLFLIGVRQLTESKATG